MTARDSVIRQHCLGGGTGDRRGGFSRRLCKSTAAKAAPTFVFIVVVFLLMVRMSAAAAGSSASPGVETAESPTVANAPLTAGSTPAAVSAPAVSPVPAPAGPYENLAIPRSANSPNSSASTNASPNATNSQWNLVQVIGALAIVIALIVLLQWFGRRVLSPGTRMGSNGAIRILCRLPMPPRQQLLLIQVGRRLVLAAGGPAQINPLCEITEPDEVAALIGQIQRGKPTSESSEQFDAVLGKAGDEYAAAIGSVQGQPNATGDAASATGAQTAGGQSTAAAADETGADPASSADPVSSASRNVLALMQTVRQLTRRFGREE